MLNWKRLGSGRSPNGAVRTGSSTLPTLHRATSNPSSTLRAMRSDVSRPRGGAESSVRSSRRTRDAIVSIIDRVPELSDVTATFIMKLVEFNRERLLSDR
ncbi:hypothetical protein ACFPM0_29350 [Pseudonocardia sulfidoxydans]|uniref:hypothetical protein n=1 Tax=Pseudonocardia sulfidoxydans TaxID=54011 RepID=UPI0036203E49